MIASLNRCGYVIMMSTCCESDSIWYHDVPGYYNDYTNLVAM